MGTLGDNLLKLIEFPFSYSLIGLLLLISGGGGFFEDASLERIGPLLILMGFAATTISIVDPIGHTLKRILLGWPSLRPRPKLKLESWNLDFRDIKDKIEETPGFGGYKVKDQILVWVLVSLLEKFYVEDCDVEKKEYVKEKQDIFERICKKYDKKRKEISEMSDAEKVLGYNDLVFRNMLKLEDEKDEKRLKELELKEKNELDSKEKEELKGLLKKLEKPKLALLKEDPIYKLYEKLQEMKYRTSTSIWLTREVDKITAMLYFVIVISAFIVALIVLPSFEDRLLTIFQGGSQTGGNNSDSAPDEDTVASEQAQEETQLGQPMQEGTTIAATQDEITDMTNMTGKDRVIHHIRAAIAATKTNDTRTAMVEINAALEELNQLERESIFNLVVRYVIIGLSIAALFFVLVMIRYRWVGLKSMAGVTFKFLIEQAAIRIDKERFDKTLGEIREYLNEGDWDSAGIWVTRIMDEYNDFIRKKVEEGEICKQWKKDKEKKVIINWKNWEMSIEGVKDKE